MHSPSTRQPRFKPFQLYVATKNGYANAVFVQEHDVQSQPIAYFSTQLDKIEQGMPPCYQGLATAAFAYEKATSITMGHKVELFTNHALHTLLTSTSFVLTNARRTGYDIILSAPELTIRKCSKVNPAERLATPEDGEPHDCELLTANFLKPRQDLYTEPLIDNDLILFVDGSCYRGPKSNLAGFAVAKYRPETDDFETVYRTSVPQPCSAQLAEIKALTAACQLAKNKRLTVFSDSAYAYGVCVIYGSIWAQRGFVRADGTKISHGDAIADLLEAIQLPEKLAIVKCAGHKSDNSLKPEVIISLTNKLKKLHQQFFNAQ